MMATQKERKPHGTLYVLDETVGLSESALSMIGKNCHVTGKMQINVEDVILY
jgi:hypothetical protein